MGFASKRSAMKDRLSGFGTGIRRWTGGDPVRRLVTALLILALSLLPLESWAGHGPLAMRANGVAPLEEGLFGLALCIPNAQSKSKSQERDAGHPCDLCVSGCCVPSLGASPVDTAWAPPVFTAAIRTARAAIDPGLPPVHAPTLGPRGPPCPITVDKTIRTVRLTSIGTNDRHEGVDVAG